MWLCNYRCISWDIIQESFHLITSANLAEVMHLNVFFQQQSMWEQLILKAILNHKMFWIHSIWNHYPLRINWTNGINTLLKLHTAKGIKSAVEQEINWFSSIYSNPQTVSQHLPASCQMLYLNGYDQICQLHGMSANELAKICVNRWKHFRISKLHTVFIWMVCWTDTLKHCADLLVQASKCHPNSSSWLMWAVVKQGRHFLEQITSEVAIGVCVMWT